MIHTYFLEQKGILENQKEGITMWVYIVTWIVATLVVDPCPNANIKDDYGRSSIITCNVFHGHFENKNMKKIFNDREEAINFIEAGNRLNKNEGFYNHLYEFKMDSVRFGEIFYRSP